jgi:hypothetical protein
MLEADQGIRSSLIQPARYTSSRNLPDHPASSPAELSPLLQPDSLIYHRGKIRRQPGSTRRCISASSSRLR